MGKVIVFPEIDLLGVKGVLIDIDDTLYSYDHCHQTALESCCMAWVSDPSRPVSSDPLDFSAQYRASRDRVTKDLYPQGACRSRLLAFMGLFERLAVPSPFVLASRYDRLYWDTFLNSMVIAPHALEFLKRVQCFGLPVVAVTDMLTEVQIQKLECLKISEYFHAIVTSEEVGSEKPFSEIFHRGLAKIGLKAQEVVMVGDSAEKDIRGAASLGIRGYQVRISIE